MLGAYEVQKWVLDLELEMDVSNHIQHIGDGAKPGSSGRAASTLNC